MKFLVWACDAQSWVFSGSKKMGAIRNGMRALTLASWRPYSVQTEKVETCAGVLRDSVAHSVACLEWGKQIGGSGSLSQGPVKRIIAT